MKLRIACNTALLLALSLLLHPQADARWGSRGWKGYGNWCGPGGSGIPVDEADQICRAHDKCRGYKTKDYATIKACPCDKKFLRDMKRVLPKLKKRYKKTPAAYVDAKKNVLFMIAFFKLRKCIKRRIYKCETRIKVVRKRKCTKKFGKKVCAKVPQTLKNKKCGYTYVFGVGGK